MVPAREIEQRLGIADRLTGCVADPRSPLRVTHRIADIIHFRRRSSPS